MKRSCLTWLAIALVAITVGAVNRPLLGAELRQVISLDGQWQIAEGAMDKIPAAFDRTVPVPGLVDMAAPAFVEPGPAVADRRKIAQKDPRRDAFWYRRTFELGGSSFPVARLKVGKAAFGTRVYLNGKMVGEHMPCFTPGCFDVSGVVKPGRNEVIIRVGADRDSITTAYPSGFDFEKERYIPGIFDSVELILCGNPVVSNVQVAPDVAGRQARVRVYLSRADGQGQVAIEIREAKSRKVAATAARPIGASGDCEIDLTVPIADCQLWSPESPFLYELTARTAGDEFVTRFGMREFRFDPATGRAMLNGKPYFMRGSNITIYRFFEDSQRGDLPWRESWVRLLHQRVKDMHWNCLRYCIGFPPEMWYRIADEEGILIQDEFPIWFGGHGWGVHAKELSSKEIAIEYAEWMRERWNHPCVVVWDASNETTSDQTSPAVAQVRSLDLSNRPWDNSYMQPQLPGDCLESHPYHFQNPRFTLAQLGSASPVPQGNPQHNDGKHAVIINEYGWLWLNRDGTPTTLTKNLYENLLGANSTTEQRRILYARYTAAESEFWRAHRNAAAVMHFTTLGYSRPDGQTSDHWIDVPNLTWEPHFYEYVRDAFAPVGLMVDAFAADYPAGQEHTFPIILINDLEQPWKGDLRLRFMMAGRAVMEQKMPVEIAGFGTANVPFKAMLPQQPGEYQFEAALLGTPWGDVRSLRDFAVLSAEQIAGRAGIAVGKAVTASSNIAQAGATNPQAACDGDPGTRWSSAFSDPQWIAIDLGSVTKINRVELAWEGAFAKSYAIQVSTDGQNWTDVHKTTAGQGGAENIRFKPVGARWVRMYGTERATRYGYSLWEFRVFRAE